MKILTHDEVLGLLRKRQGDRSMRGFAAALGVSVAYLSDVYRKQRQPGKKLLAFMGLKKESVRTVTYFENGSGKGKDKP